MKKLIEIIKETEENRMAVGHFNVSDIIGLKAVFEAAYKLQLPIIIGVSEGEGDFIGRRQIAALVKSLKEEYNYPIFLNADHTKSLEKIKEAVEAGFDSVMFDGSKLLLEDNIKQTKNVVEYVKSVNPEILVEGEIGYIKGKSTILTTSDVQNIDDDLGTSDVKRLIKEGDLAKPEEAAQFVKETNIDLLAPAVGNIHGIVMRTNADFTQTNAEVNKAQTNADYTQTNAEINKAQTNTDYTQTNAEKNPRESAFSQRESASMIYMNPSLNIQRIRDIKRAVGIPLVLHGGSGIKDEEILAAIDAGISIVHINTELRLAWRRGLEEALKEKPEEVVPYKLLPQALDEIKKVVEKKLRLFNRY
jgi:fructose-bisphosphate aldolase class II